MELVVFYFILNGTFLSENVSKLFIVKFLVENEINNYPKCPRVGGFRLVLSDQNFGRLVKFYFFLALDD